MHSFAYGIMLCMKTNNAQLKDQINTENEYFFGFPRGRYGEVLDELARTKVNSCRTSSIPLAEFWQPANLSRIEEILKPCLRGFNPRGALKFFEFPTEAVFNNKEIGKPSMSDLMILDRDWQIAIEAKYTEYVRGPSRTLSEWLSEGAADSLRPAVAKVWFDYIDKAGCTGLQSFEEFLRNCADVGYQFLHRTASACNKANDSDGKSPVLVYQLFYKAGDASHIASMEKCKSSLRNWAQNMKLRRMKFLVLCVPVMNDDEVEARFGAFHGEIFEKMKFETIYKFDFDGMEIEEVALALCCS